MYRGVCVGVCICTGGMCGCAHVWGACVGVHMYGGACIYVCVFRDMRDA